MNLIHASPMTLFVITMTNSAAECPTANSKVRQLLANERQEVTKLAARVGMKLIVGPLMGATNQSYTVVDEPKIEMVTDLKFRLGLIQWNKVEVVYALTVEEAEKPMRDMTPTL